MSLPNPHQCNYTSYSPVSSLCGAGEYCAWYSLIFFFYISWTQQKNDSFGKDFNSHTVKLCFKKFSRLREQWRVGLLMLVLVVSFSVDTGPGSMKWDGQMLG